MQQTSRPGHIRVDDIANAGEVLIEKRMPKSTPGIRREHVDRTAPDGRVELVDAFLLGEVEVERLDDLRARLTSQVGGRLFNFHLVCGNQKVIPFARAYARKLVTDPCRCAGSRLQIA